jgi:hypothetical protein
LEKAPAATHDYIIIIIIIDHAAIHDVDRAQKIVKLSEATHEFRALLGRLRNLPTNKIASSWNFM